MPYFSSTALAPAKVVGSATVGPEGITAGSCAGNIGDGQGDHSRRKAAAARRPPLTAERCFLTQFISEMVAPDLSSVMFTACLSSRVRPGAGRVRSADPPPEIRHITRSSTESAPTIAMMRAAAARPAASGTGWARLHYLDRPARHRVAVAGDHQARKPARPVLLHRPRHGRGRLAEPHHHGPARGSNGKIVGYAMGGLGHGHGPVEHGSEKLITHRPFPGPEGTREHQSHIKGMANVRTKIVCPGRNRDKYLEWIISVMWVPTIRWTLSANNRHDRQAPSVAATRNRWFSCDCRKGGLRLQTQRDTIVNQDDAEALKQELVGLFQYIRRVRQEIAAIYRPADGDNQFDSMADQLDAIVGATEEATNTIMEAMEKKDEMLAKLREGSPMPTTLPALTVSPRTAPPFSRHVPSRTSPGKGCPRW